MISIAATADLIGLEPERVTETLTEHFAGRGQPGYRVEQVLRWLYERLAPSFDEMTDLPQAERAALAEAFSLTAWRPSRSPAPTTARRSTSGAWRDGELIESVLIPTRSRLTLCISSQAGCAMACTFCATGWMGYQRQLTAGEIVAQYRAARAWALENGYGEISNIVFMGMGEPLMNRKAVFPTLAILNRALRRGRAPDHRLHRGDRRRGSRRWRRCRSSSGSRCRSTRPTTSCARS